MIREGDLVRYVGPAGLEFSPHRGRSGIVLKVDVSYHGARQAFKAHPRPRGHVVLGTRKADFLAPTKDGILDRILVLWGDDNHFEYVASSEVERIA